MSDEPFESVDHRETQGLTSDGQALYRRLLDDGVAWRAASQEIQDLGVQLQRRAAALGTPPESAAHPRQAQVRTLDHVSPSRPYPKGASSMLHGRIGGFAAVMATVTIVGALAALLLIMAPGHHRISAPSPGGSPSGPDQHGVWTDLTQLDYNPDFSANDVPAIAPSDPRVVYETLAHGYFGGSSVQPTQLRRTDDEGVTWHALPVPVPADHVGNAGIVVSPLNAHVVFLTLFDFTATDCPADRAQPNTEAGAGSTCWLQYTSADGGAHWTPTHLPLAGGHVAGVLAGPTFARDTGDIVSNAQDSHLYAGFRCVDYSCNRLIVSGDGGLTWQFVDQPLMASAKDVCDYTAAPTDATIYVVTTPKECYSYDQVPLTLWRSDDAGAHWTLIGDLATPNERGALLVHELHTGAPLLYVDLLQTISIATDKGGGKPPTFSAAPTDVKVSADGGRTWAAAPSQGIPVGQQPVYDRGLVGSLPDGSIVIEVVPQGATADFGGGTLYAWKRGDPTWHQLAPPITRELGAMLVTPSKSGGLGAIWLVLVNRASSASGALPPSPGDTFTFVRYEP